MKKNFVVILVLLFLLILISGCINILPTLEEEPITPGKGRLKIYLTDSSGDYKVGDDENYLAVNITISEIKVHLAGEDEEAEGEWIEWELKGKNEFDLIQLKNDGISELFSEKELDPGKYTQIRLFITEANVWVEMASKESEENIASDSDEEKDIIVESSEFYEEYNLEIPSNLQTGLKLIHPFEIIENGETELTIDFDAEKSIVKIGNGSYKLKPVIKVITVSTGEVEEED